MPKSRGTCEILTPERIDLERESGAGELDICSLLVQLEDDVNFPSFYCIAALIRPPMWQGRIEAVTNHLSVHGSLLTAQPCGLVDCVPKRSLNGSGL